MRKTLVLFLGILWILGCQPVELNLVSSPSYLPIQNEKENSALNQLIEPYKKEIDAEMNKVIGRSEQAMPKLNGMPETLLGNFVADLVLEYARTVDKETDFCILNNGGLRSSLPAGDITLRNVYELMPFDNEVVIVELDGKKVRELFSYVAERGGVPVAGVNLKLEKMNGTMVPSTTLINGEKFSTDRSYKIATSDYLSGGGDSMNFWTTGTIQTTLKKIRDAIIDFIRLKTDQNKIIEPFLDQRISVIN